MAQADPQLSDNALTYEQTAARLQISVRLLRDMVTREEIPYRKLGRLVRFYWPQIVLWLQHTGAKK